MSLLYAAIKTQAIPVEEVEISVEGVDFYVEIVEPACRDVEKAVERVGFNRNYRNDPPSLCWMCAMWLRTVETSIWRCWAMAVVVHPAATSS